MNKLNIQVFEKFLSSIMGWELEESWNNTKLFSYSSPGDTIKIIITNCKGKKALKEELDLNIKDKLPTDVIYYLENPQEKVPYPKEWTSVDKLFHQELKRIKNALKDVFKNIEANIKNTEEFPAKNFEGELPILDIETVNYKERRNYKLKEEVDTFLKNEKKDIFLLLGDFGEGKTFFCKHFVKDKLKKLIEVLENDDKTNASIDITEHSIPIFIDLSTSSFNDIDEIITKKIIQTVGCRGGVDAGDDWKTLCKSGIFTLVIDGFDQMNLKSTFAVEEFRKVVNWVSEGGKCIFTCRTLFYNQYFDQNISLSKQTLERLGTIHLLGVKDLNNDSKINNLLLQINAKEIMKALSVKAGNKAGNKPLFFKLLLNYALLMEEKGNNDKKDLKNITELLDRSYEVCMERKTLQERKKIDELIIDKLVSRMKFSRNYRSDTQFEDTGEQLQEMSYFFIDSKDNTYNVKFRFPIFLDYFQSRFCVEELTDRTQARPKKILTETELSIEVRQFIYETIVTNSKYNVDYTTELIKNIKNCQTKNGQDGQYLSINSANLCFDLMRSSSPYEQEIIRKKLKEEDVFRNVVLTKVDAHGINLQDISFLNSHLDGANFSYTKLTNVGFGLASLNNVIIGHGGNATATAITHKQNNNLSLIGGTNHGSIFHGTVSSVRRSQNSNIQNRFNVSRFGKNEITSAHILKVPLGDNADYPFLFTQTDSNIYVYKRLGHHIYHTGTRGILSSAILEHDNRAVLTGLNGEIILFDIVEGKILSTVSSKKDGEYLSAATVIPNENNVNRVLIGNSRGKIYTFEIEGDKITEISNSTLKHNSNIIDISDLAVSGNNNDMLVILTNMTGEIPSDIFIIPLDQLKTGTIELDNNKLEIGIENPTCMAVPLSSDQIFLGSKTSVLWGIMKNEKNTMTLTERKNIPEEEVTSLSCTRDGEYFLTGGREIHIYHAETRQLIMTHYIAANCEGLVLGGARGLNDKQLCYMLSQGALMPNDNFLKQYFDIKDIDKNKKEFFCSKHRKTHPIEQLRSIEQRKPSCKEYIE